MDKDTEKNKIRRYLNGTYVMSEVDELHDTIRCASTDNEDINEVAAEVWDECAEERKLTAFGEKSSYREAHQLLQGLKTRRKWNFRRLGYAAVGIAASFILIFLGLYTMDEVKESQVQMMAVSTSYGERKQILLADGSKIILNACSRLEYPDRFEGDTREVNLHGQAFFEVARNEEQPFFVQTGKFHVQVLGTEFDVKSYQEDEMVSVDVKSGKVEVTLSDATLRLKKNEQILMNTVSGDFNKKRGNREVASWRKGNLSFNHTPIRDVARELERIYHCKINFCEGQEFANMITGEHDNQSLESILESLHYVSGVNYRTEGDGSILLFK